MKDSEYKKQSEPSMAEKSYVWKTAIGLQAVDGLKPSKYLIATANKNIKGQISIDEAEKHKLSNREMHISGKFKKTDIQKANIQKANIGINKTNEHIRDLYKAFGTSKVFGRTDASIVTGLKATRLSELFGILLNNKIIIKVDGHGKGKYRFVKKF